MNSARRAFENRMVEDIEVWELKREPTRKVYSLTKKHEFARNCGFKGQIQDAAGSAMRIIAEGSDSESNCNLVRLNEINEPYPTLNDEP